MMKKGLDKIREKIKNMYDNVILLIDGHKWRKQLSESFLGTAEDFVSVYEVAAQWQLFCCCSCLMI